MNLQLAPNEEALDDFPVAFHQPRMVQAYSKLQRVTQTRVLHGPHNEKQHCSITLVHEINQKRFPAHRLGTPMVSAEYSKLASR